MPDDEVQVTDVYTSGDGVVYYDADGEQHSTTTEAWDSATVERD